MVALRQHGLPQRVCFTHNRFRTTCRYPFLPGTSYNRQGRLWIAEVDENADGNIDTRSTYRYDDSGIRIAQREQVDSDDDGAFDEDTTTVNLVDHRNPTGYQQVLEETQLHTATEAVQRRRIFTLGLDVISQQDAETAYGSPLFLLYDGHGSTRALTYLGDYMMEGGLLVAGQLFRYDAYGNSIDFDPTAAYTNLLYSGEHLDTATNQQYLRARYYDLATGRFNRLDPFAGNLQDPASLHEYLYVHGDPVIGIDPSGMMTVSSLVSSLGNLLSMATRTITFVQKAYTAIDAVTTLINIWETVSSIAFGGPIRSMIHSTWSTYRAMVAASPLPVDAMLFTDTLWEASADSFKRHSLSLFNKIVASPSLLRRVASTITQHPKSVRFVVQLPMPNYGWPGSFKKIIPLPLRVSIRGVRVGVAVQFGGNRKHKGRLIGFAMQATATVPEQQILRQDFGHWHHAAQVRGWQQVHGGSTLLDHGSGRLLLHFFVANQ